MYIKVLPIDISFGKEALIYYIKDEQRKYLNIGSIVSVPIKNMITNGVVSDFHKTQEDTNFGEIKSIIDILCSLPIIDTYEINLVFGLANKYFLNLNKVLNLFLPKFILNRLEKNAFQDILSIEYEKNTKRKHSLPVFIHNMSFGNIEDVINKNAGGLEDCVLVFGDDFSIDSFLEKNEKYKDSALIYKNSYTYSRKYKLFLDILSKKKNILFGTRKVLQYNLANYKKIIYIEDSIVRYNYNQQEKYKNLDIINFISKQDIFDIYYISSIPSVELFYLSKINNYNYKVV